MDVAASEFKVEGVTACVAPGGNPPTSPLCDRCGTELVILISHLMNTYMILHVLCMYYACICQLFFSGNPCALSEHQVWTATIWAPGTLRLRLSTEMIKGR